MAKVHKKEDVRRLFANFLIFIQNFNISMEFAKLFRQRIFFRGQAPEKHECEFFYMLLDRLDFFGVFWTCICICDWYLYVHFTAHLYFEFCKLLCVVLPEASLLDEIFWSHKPQTDD